MLNRQIFLTGMPGSGKSVLGRRAAREAGVAFLDLDDWIAAQAGMSIPEIFEKYGEEGFRRIETGGLIYLTRLQPAVIALGGGAVLNPVNRKIIRGFGSVILLDRPPEQILSDLRPEERPLLRDDPEASLWKLYDERMPTYRSIADVTIRNDGSFEDALNLLLRVLKEIYHA